MALEIKQYKSSPWKSETVYDFIKFDGENYVEVIKYIRDRGAYAYTGTLDEIKTLFISDKWSNENLNPTNFTIVKENEWIKIEDFKDGDIFLYVYSEEEISKKYTELSVSDIASVRAKFEVSSNNIDSANPTNGHSIRLQAVVNGSPENESFYKWTPSGQIQLSVVSPAVAEKFVVGKQYYVDFTEAN